MNKAELKKLANEQINHMLKQNGEQSAEISKMAEKASPKDRHFVWIETLNERAKNKKVAKELERMYAWDCNL